MKLLKSLLLALAAIALSLPVSAQVSRINFTSSTTNAQCAPGAQCPILAIPGSTVQVCTYSVSGCGATATTYSDATGSTPCPTFSQVSPGCVPTTDNNGNGGVWVNSGNYNVYLTPPGGAALGPFPFTAGGSGGGGGGSPGAPFTSIQYNSAGSFAGSSVLTFNGTSLVTAANAYNALTSNTDGIRVPAYDVSQGASGMIGGYLVFNPITYNPYNQPGTCLDIYGNPVQQPLPLNGTSFGTFASVLWVAESPSLPSSPTAGCPTPGGPPLPVNPSNALWGLNTNSYFFARGGLATDDAAYNSIQSLQGGLSIALGATMGQAIYPFGHSPCSTLNSLSGDPGYGGFGYQSGSIYCYWNGSAWASVNLSALGGVPGGSNLDIQYNNAGAFGGTNNAELDANGNLSLAGTGSVLAINGPSGGVRVSADAEYNSIQTIGGMFANSFTALKYTNIGSSAGAPTPSAGDALQPGFTYYDTVTHCLETYSGSAFACNGGGSGSPGGPSTSVQFNNAGSFGGVSTLTYNSSTRLLTAFALNSSSPSIAAATGFMQSDAGFIATSGTCNNFNCIQAPTGGGEGLNWTAANYIQTGHSTGAPTLTTGDALHQGAMYWDDTAHCPEVRNDSSAWVCLATGGATTPGGSTSDIQFNSGGAFAGSNGLTWTAANNDLTVTGNSTTGSQIVLDTAAASHQSTFALNDNGTTIWKMGRNTDDAFFLEDQTSGGVWVEFFAPGPTGSIGLAPRSGTVDVFSSIGVAGVAVSSGFSQADGGFIATSGTCLNYNCIQAPTGGLEGENVNLTNYLLMAQNASPSPSAGDNWSSGQGVAHFNLGSWYFSYGTGTNTIADAPINGSAVTLTQGNPALCSVCTLGASILGSGQINSLAYFLSSATGSAPAFVVSGNSFVVTAQGTITVNSSAAGLAVLGTGATNSIQTTGGVSAAVGFSSASTQYNAFQAASGGMLATGFTWSCSSTPPALSGAGFLRTYCNSTSGLEYSLNGAAYTTFGGGGAVSGIIGTANQVLANSTSGSMQTGNVTLTTFQPLAYTSFLGFGSVTAGCGGPGSNNFAFTSCATGATIGFSTNNNDFEVDGQGDVSALQQFNVTGGAGAYKMQGTTVINALGIFTGSSVNTSGGGTFGSAIAANGGIVSGVGTNSTIIIGTGSLYTRAPGGSAGISCSGINDGWLAVTSDNYVVFCVGGARFRALAASY